MNIFDPRTFSTDWEINVIDKLERCVGSEKLMAFSGALRAEFDLPVQVDWNSLEFALGINSSFDQIWKRIKSLTDRAQQILREFGLELYPCGAHPTQGLYNSAHIHVGTVHDESQAIHLENSLMKYMPAFAALAANSPVAHASRGEFKSYRVKELANYCTHPSDVRDPELSQVSWGTDACPKIYGGPTLEIRIPDCASSRRLLAEFATLIAAFVHHKGTELNENYKPSPTEYREYLTNRWAAAKYGMQATFTWDGKPKSAAELLSEMMDECAEELAVLGVKRSDLELVEMMIAKRICQSDYVMSFMDRYPDVFVFASVHAKLVRHWEIFDEYLQSAPTLDLAPVVDRKVIIAEHLAKVGEGTHFYNLRGAMCYPSPATDEIIQHMVENGLIRREVSAEYGTVLYRVSRS